MSDWAPVDQAAKDANGNFQVLMGGQWKPASQVAKNQQGQFVAMLDDGAPAPNPRAAEVPRAISAPEPAPTQPRPSPFLSKVLGSVEAALHVAGQVGSMVGMAGGTIGGLAGAMTTEQYGTPEGATNVEQSATAGAQRGQGAVEGGLRRLVGLPGNSPVSAPGQEMAGGVDAAMSQLPAMAAGPRGMVGMNGGNPSGIAEAARTARASPSAAAITEAAPAAARPVLAARSAARAAEGAKVEALTRPELEGIRAAHDAGYKLTPKAAKAGVGARIAETAAGSPRLAQELAAHNAENTARLARADVGLPEDVPVTPEATQKIRQEAGQDYQAVRDLGRFQNDAQYASDLGKITSGVREAAGDYPGLLDNPLIKHIEALKQEEVSTGSAIEAVKELRDKADIAFRAGSKKLGGAYRAAAETVDASMERALVKRAGGSDAKLVPAKDSSGNPVFSTPEVDPSIADAVDRYRAARVRIAKTYLLDDAMDGKPGEVNAKVYARALDKGAKLTGPAEQIANFGKQFGDEGLAAKKGRSGAVGPTFHDIALGALLRSPLETILTVGARPAARAVLGSDLMQRRMAGSKPLPREPEPVAPAEAPAEPTLGQGFENVPQGQSAPAASPLGDLTPDWQTAPGAVDRPRVEVVPTEGLVPAVGEEAPLPQGVPQRPGSQIPLQPDQPLGDLTPNWQTAPGASGAAPQQAVGGLHRAVGEEAPTTGPRKDLRQGLQIPAVEGRPDLPDTMVTGRPTETAATQATGDAMQAPDAALARRQQMGEVERIRAKTDHPEVTKVLDEHAAVLERQAKADALKARNVKAAGELRRAAGLTKDADLAKALRRRADALEDAEKIPVGKATEGLPAEKPVEPAKPIPAGEAKELPVETVVAEDPSIPTGEATEIQPEGVTDGQRLEPNTVRPEPAAEGVQANRDTGSKAQGQKAQTRSGSPQIGGMYVDKKGRRAIYQADGTWKVLK